MNQKKTTIGSVVVGIALIVSTSVISGYSQSTVTINVDGATNVVPKTMFGSLMERLGRQWSGQGSIFVGTSSSIPNIDGMRKDVLDGLKECGLGAAQWPGGCAGWNYKWNPPAPSNDVGTYRFLEFCKYVGSEPIICGPHYAESYASNLAWVKYIDSTTTKLGMDSLRWFKIGNEVWGGCGAGMDLNTYITNYLSNYNKLSAYRPSLKFESCSQNEEKGEGVQTWFKTLVNTLGSKHNGIEYHDYIFHTSWNSEDPTTDQYWQIMADGTVADFAYHLKTNVFPAMNSADPEKKIKIIVDEWGDWLKGDNWLQTGTLMDGLSAANQLHLMMANTDRIEVACIAQGISVIHSLININTSGQMVKTPTFYVFKLFKPHRENGAKWAPITASNIKKVKKNVVPYMYAAATNMDIPLMTVGSTVDKNGNVNISVNNMDLTASGEITFTLTSSVDQYTMESAQILTGAALNSANPFGGEEIVIIKPFAASNYTLTGNGKTLTATLPARSVVMFRLNPPTSGTEVHSEKTADKFSIKTGLQGTILVKLEVNKKTPLTIEVFTLDGKCLVENYSGSLEPGMHMVNWKPKNKINGSNVYVLKVKAGNFIQSKRIIL
jgi:alpha-N-arabinofuranosidase